MLDPITIIKTLGLIGIFVMVCAESGIIFGFFLPGDTLLFSAGIFASQGYFSIQLLVIVCALAAIIGDSIGYWTGKRFGRGLFEKDNSFFFNRNRLAQAEHFYHKHGSLTIIIARFLPMIRTFAPIIAGVADMPYKIFLAYNIIGGILWAASVPLLGYYLGNLIPNIDALIVPILLFIIVISFVPAGIQVIRYYLGKRRS